MTISTAPHTSLPHGFDEDDRYPPLQPDPSVLESLTGGATRIVFGGAGSSDKTRITLYAGGAPVKLRDILPALESFDFEVLDEQTSSLLRGDGLRCYAYQFTAVPKTAVISEHDDRVRLTESFDALWQGVAESDAFNHLTSTARLDWRLVTVLRAYARFLRQTPLPYSQTRIESVLLQNPEAARALADLFVARFDPEVDASAREALISHCANRVSQQIEASTSIDADRVLRAYLSVVSNSQRTNFFREGSLTRKRPYFSVKLRSENIDLLPAPRPMHEIFVYSPRFEGVHLRFGDVARGGLRWSDRQDDYREEILGLAKTQGAKNAVIVPAGAKGGFVLRRPHTDIASAEAPVSREDVLECYSFFISGLLDVTDTYRTPSEVVSPVNVVCHDGPDPYLVVAADKGTATFSDTANSVAEEYDFWLRDAFASGGKNGYDHKTIGITARGAWVSVERHLKEADIDPYSQVFTVAGIGDMSGDVFGNGMLLSSNIALVAAFDHRHIFIDPTPDVDASYGERSRLFKLEGSTWAHYDRELISRGGGVWRRDSRSIPLDDNVRAALGLPDEVHSLAPNELVRAILSAPVALLWNGGIGTYVRSSAESDLAVGDKVNDSVRVPATEVRAQVVGEGGNLGITARGRVELARRGVRLNSDAIDNSAGVDCSDHEVNIKVLIDISGADRGDERSALLSSMTTEVTELVLANNHAQNRILSEARDTAAAMIDVHSRMIDRMEVRRGFDRALEVMPTGEQLDSDDYRTRGLSSPELGTLLAHAKLDLTEDLADHPLFDSGYFRPVFQKYFPGTLGRTAAVAFDSHPLRRQILATRVVNEIAELGGITYAFRLIEDTGVSAADVVRAFSIAKDVFGIGAVQQRIIDAALPPAVENALMAESRRILDRASRWFLSNRRQPLDIDDEIRRFSGLHELVYYVGTWLRGTEAKNVGTATDRWVEAGVPYALARDVSESLFHYSLLDVMEASEASGVPANKLGPVYFALSDKLGVDRMLMAVSALPRGDRWHSLARLALRDELYQSLKMLTQDVVLNDEAVDDVEQVIEDWRVSNVSRIRRARAILAEVQESNTRDLPALAVAARQIRSMVQGRNTSAPTRRS